MSGKEGSSSPLPTFELVSVEDISEMCDSVFEVALALNQHIKGCERGGQSRREVLSALHHVLDQIAKAEVGKHNCLHETSSDS